jgi:predicted PurR-regulated permease PerM
MLDPITARFTPRIMVSLLLGGLLILGYIVLQPFIVPVAWAMIIAYATWPLFSRLQKQFNTHKNISALLMTLLLTTAFVLPTLWMLSLLHDEAKVAFVEISSRIKQTPPEIPQYIKTIPWFGHWLTGLVAQITADPSAFQDKASLWISEGSNQLISILGDVGRNAAKLGFALITLFFLFRDGEQLLSQVHQVLYRFLGARIDNYVTAVGQMTRAVVWGLIATAIAQGVVAGFGYWWTGIPAPVLCGALTTLVALIPFGAPFAWVTLAGFLLLEGHYLNGVILLLWGSLAVSSVDNIVRPMVISNATRIPFLLVMFGVLGGLTAFGLVGLFLGPVILAILMAIWQEWLDESALQLSDEVLKQHEDLDQDKQSRN